MLRIKALLFGVNLFESLIVDQNPHWEGALYKGGVPRGILGKVKEYLDLPLKDAVKEKWLYGNAARVFGIE